MGTFRRSAVVLPAIWRAYSAGTDIIAGVNPTTMDFASGCYIGYVDLLSPSQVVWNNADVSATGGDNVTVTYLDGTPDKDENLQPDLSPTRTTWNFATDSVAMDVSSVTYLYVCDLSNNLPRLVVFVDSSSAVEQWQQY